MLNKVLFLIVFVSNLGSSTLAMPAFGKRTKPVSMPVIQDTTKEEDNIIDSIFALPEVKEKSRFIESLTHHKHGITIIIRSRPNSEKSYYLVQAGFNSSIRFEPYYNFYVYPKGMIIKYLDTLTNEIYSLKAWRQKRKKDNHKPV